MIKVLIGLLLSLALVSPSFAADKEPDITGQYCSGVMGLSEMMMTARLSGVSVVDMMDLANSSHSPTLSREMVQEAFAEPLYSTEEYIEDAIREFGAKYYLDCMKNA